MAEHEQVDNARMLQIERELAAVREQLRAETTLTAERFASLDRALNAALNAQKEAVLKSEAANEKRFEGVNEFRGQLKDQAATFITRSEIWGWAIALLGLGVGLAVAMRHW